MITEINTVEVNSNPTGQKQSDKDMMKETERQQQVVLK